MNPCSPLEVTPISLTIMVLACIAKSPDGSKVGYVQVYTTERTLFVASS